MLVRQLKEFIATYRKVIRCPIIQFFSDNVRENREIMQT